ncbi:nickel ABC transporter ATP-binding protein NikE [Microbacterium trichothecenolyticum]|uniref:Peptide/nickel transport system ATP-binding protein n=1 Tax=Microbacterium trichothecenolyticum TaxID=69370 RepID=A0ABU0TWZ1_MICTR|nr:ABC transporter ATP-binding protein [Microbacterium trichothecenolyticum]MDQ1123469.1 peptide/nickel transport system ATP-binding protein [Microbacterium trichothecenolyticum]
MNTRIGPVAASPTALRIRDLNVWFDARDDRRAQAFHALQGIDLDVAPGERVGLVGESGSGKTTTILAAMGLLPASATVAGAVTLEANGPNLLSAGERGIRPHRWSDIAMVFQGAMSAMNPVHTVGWQIRETLAAHGVAIGEAARARTRELLAQVGLPAGTEDRYPHQLSGGMKQRVVIAMALCCEPKVLLADEPTTALDVVVQDQILRLLVKLSEELQLGLLLVTHDLGVVAQACTRAAVMRDGRIIEEGRVEDLYLAPAHTYTRELFEATPDLAAMPRRTPAADGTTLLSVRDVTVVYGGRRRRSFSAPGAIDFAGTETFTPETVTEMIATRSVAADDVSRDLTETASNAPRRAAVDRVGLDVREGELVALVGQSGCGKTTLLQTLIGLQRVAEGSIRFRGQEVSAAGARTWRALRRDIQLIYQDPYEALDSRDRIADIVAEPLRIHRIASSASDRRRRVDEALREVGLDPDVVARRFPHELSGGQRQRVAIAASIVLRPRLLLADEPVSMLDVSVRTGVLALLDRLRREHRMGILMITHDLSTAAAYADRIVVMREGRVVEQADAWDVVNSPASPYTRHLIETVPSPDPRRRRA